MRLIHNGDPEEIRSILNPLRVHWHAVHLETCNVIVLDGSPQIALQLADHPKVSVLPHGDIPLSDEHLERLKGEGVKKGHTLVDALSAIHQKYGSHALNPHLPL
jgi:hypothetical protein